MILNRKQNSGEGVRSHLRVNPELPIEYIPPSQHFVNAIHKPSTPPTTTSSVLT